MMVLFALRQIMLTFIKFRVSWPLGASLGVTVVFTNKGLNVQRIYYLMKGFGLTSYMYVLPKLSSIYDNCVAPKIISPTPVIGLPLRLSQL